MNREVTQCPFCEGDEDGCCFCDHSGRVYIGEGYVFQTMEDLKPFKRELVKESDLRRLWDAGQLDNRTQKI
jgi:hypothetical protein